MEIRKDKDKRIEEKEKWDAEVARGLSVVEVKKVHRQIEDVERLRKRDAILSIRDRITSLSAYLNNIIDSIHELKKKNPNADMAGFSVGPLTLKYVNAGFTRYKSIRLDMERNIDVGKENFDKIFPMLEIESTSYSFLGASVSCIYFQLNDMNDYLKRLL